MPPTYNSADYQLISDLRTIEKRTPKLIKSSVYPAPAEPSISIQSWKMNELKYYDVPSPFPTLARGVFTMGVSEEEDSAKHRIVVRGYDKFFNIGEVPWTTWEAIEKNTTAPYTLSLKANGCVIFIAALTPQKLLITSKHSLGPIKGAIEQSHAEAGEEWLRKYLEAKGRTEEELAARLWESNWTAVAELCDDSFEEHVIGYPPERTGLHLHGLNVTTKEFKTMPQDVVDAFAEEWGFIKTRSHVVNSIKELREFTSHIAKVGEWDGEAVEGFVIRTTYSPEDGAKAKSPYTSGSSFFFKIKIDEPYMMYRDWREVTKKLLSIRGPLSAAGLSKVKMQRKETRVYAHWVINEIQKDRSQFDEYTQGHGIIATRDRFLKWYEEQKARGVPVEGEKDKKPVVQTPKSKVLIAPIAIPGCGKTSVSLALAHLFNCGHTQSDNVKAKRPAPVFQQNVRSQLQRRRVVIADKNNHLRLHRQQLHEVARKFKPYVRIIALRWSFADKSPAVVHKIVSDRIVNRGGNHQTLIAKGTLEHEDVVWMFINQSEELREGEVDGCVDLNIEDDLEGMVRSAVDGLWELIGGEGGVLGDEKPSEERIREALEIVKEYTVKDNSKPVAPGSKIPKPPRYYGLLPDIKLEEMVDGVFANAADDGSLSSGAEFWEQLKKAGRVTKLPHVTIVHHKALPQESDIWDLAKPVASSPSPPMFNIKFGKVLWNQRVMVLTVERIEQVEGEETREGGEFVDGMPEAVRDRLHVTVGTAGSGVPPVEGKVLVERWRRGGRDAEGICEADVGLGVGVVATGPLKGLFA